MTTSDGRRDETIVERRRALASTLARASQLRARVRDAMETSEVSSAETVDGAMAVEAAPERLRESALALVGSSPLGDHGEDGTRARGTGRRRGAATTSDRGGGRAGDAGKGVS